MIEDHNSKTVDPQLHDRLRALPSVDAVLGTATAQRLSERFGQVSTRDAIRSVLNNLRAEISATATTAPSAQGVADHVVTVLEADERSLLPPVFNLTGTVLHTNLGRALLCEAAIEAASSAMRNAVALEYDLDGGRRGDREDAVRELLCSLTGAEDATVVNNNAAAVLLVVNTFANNREAIVSRGELIEIGGAFRMPDIMSRAGAKLVEVGTTNRTHAKDYRAALGSDTGLILKVHTSNYRILGFIAEVGARDLAAIARDANVPLANDLGSGTLIDLTAVGLQREPTVQDAVAEGADLVLFSGDKLLGGPQAGFVVGKRTLIQEIKRNPLKRTLRIDKIRLAAIEATLKLYRDPRQLMAKLPTFRHLARSQDEIAAQAQRLLPTVASALGSDFSVQLSDCASEVGSGASPLDSLPSAGLTIHAVGGDSALRQLARHLRQLEKPIIGRLQSGSLRFDFRCLDDDRAFVEAIATLDRTALATCRKSPDGA